MVEEKIREIKEKSKKAVECPYCKRKVKLKRKASGIFKCPKCKETFTGRAYYLKK